MGGFDTLENLVASFEWWWLEASEFIGGRGQAVLWFRVRWEYIHGSFWRYSGVGGGGRYRRVE